MTLTVGMLQSKNPKLERKLLTEQYHFSWLVGFNRTSVTKNFEILCKRFSNIMLFFIWAVVLLGALALYFNHVYSRFSKYGVKHKMPIPLLGNMGPMIMRWKHYCDIVNDLYVNNPGERFVGRYDFVNPSLIIRDLELIKKITVKDFEHFLDHSSIVDEKLDPFFGRNLFSLKGQEWKDMRSTMSPAFTSSKMKHMLPFMVEIGIQMINSIKLKMKDTGSSSVEIDAKDISTRYANDVIASCAFGLKVDSTSEPDNEFYRMGYKASNFEFAQILKFIGYASVPALMRRFKVRLFSEDVTNFFEHLVVSTMKDREEHNTIRPDMIHLLMEVKKGRLTHETSNDADAGFATVEESQVGKKTVNRAWSDVDLIAQAAIFFIAGFKTISTALTFLMYELAINPEVQERLYQEIKEHEKTHDGKFEYNAILKMPYMDMVVSEILRLWPPAISAERHCVKDYNLGKVNDKATKDYIIKKGEGLNIPIMAIHRFPGYYPNPMKFDPERFSEENKHKITPFTYLPFGLGPRNCIGSRFALFEIKVMIFMLLQHFEISPSAKTRIPVKLSTETVNLRMKGGHYLQLKLRS